MNDTAYSRRITDALLADRKEPAEPTAPPVMTVTWTSNARPDRDTPGAVYAAQLLARTVDHLKVAHEHGQELLVPHAAERIGLLLEAAGLTPAAVVKYGDLVARELRVLLAEYDRLARDTLHRRLGVDLAATLVPVLTDLGGSS